MTMIYLGLWEIGFITIHFGIDHANFLIPNSRHRVWFFFLNPRRLRLTHEEAVHRLNDWKDVVLELEDSMKGIHLHPDRFTLDNNDEIIKNMTCNHQAWWQAVKSEREESEKLENHAAAKKRPKVAAATAQRSSSSLSPKATAAAAQPGAAAAETRRGGSCRRVTKKPAAAQGEAGMELDTEEEDDKPLAAFQGAAKLDAMPPPNKKQRVGPQDSSGSGKKKKGGPWTETAKEAWEALGILHHWKDPPEEASMPRHVGPCLYDSIREAANPWYAVLPSREKYNLHLCELLFGREDVSHCRAYVLSRSSKRTACTKVHSRLYPCNLPHTKVWLEALQRWQIGEEKMALQGFMFSCLYSP
jgi:hypothetical protein